MAKDFVCRRHKTKVEDRVELTEKLCDEVQTLNGLFYLGDRLNACGGCQTVMTVRTKHGG